MLTMKLEDFKTALSGQGVPREHYAFTCPMCGTVQSAASLVRAGAGKTFEAVDQTVGWSCVGRYTGAGTPKEEKGKGRGCNWTLGGLFCLHDFEVETEDGIKHPHFAPASPEDAKILMLTNKVLGTVDGRSVFAGDELYHVMHGNIAQPLRALTNKPDVDGEIIVFEGGAEIRSEQLVWQPKITVEIPPEIMAIARNIATQDNRYTDQPLFAVEQKREYVGDEEYSSGEDRIVWVESNSGDYCEASPLRAKRLELLNDHGRTVEGWDRHFMIIIWEFVTGGMTEQGCKDYIKANCHNLKEPRIYAHGSDRNREFRTLRNFLLSLIIKEQQ